jgi:outer membrane scaffolding protein for murein synthesis (MipA/OmpV family)
MRHFAAMPTPRLLVICGLLAPALAARAQSTATQDAGDAERGGPRWEAGLAVGGGRVADYPGADQSHVRGLVAPLFIYRGPVLRVDPGGVRGRMLDSPDWDLDLSATGAFNARNNDARRAMPGLDWLFGVGPQLVYKGRQRANGITLHVKARAVFSTDFHRVQDRGATLDPELRWRLRPIAGDPSSLTLSVQPTWATRRLQRYFYPVDASEALPGRPAYDARAGYLGTELGATWTRRQGNVSWFVGARVLSLHGAANAASPLLRDRSNVGIGAGLGWTPWRSAESAGP